MTREEAIDVLKCNYPSACFEDLCEAVEIAIQALSAPPERKKGKWIGVKIGNGDTRYTCSECGVSYERDSRERWDFNFCPNCGTEMGGKS